VESQGGRVTVEDRPGGGSVFAVAIPRPADVLPGAAAGVGLATPEGALYPSD
jgi:hypothetical protein